MDQLKVHTVLLQCIVRHCSVRHCSLQCRFPTDKLLHYEDICDKVETCETEIYMEIFLL